MARWSEASSLCEIERNNRDQAASGNHRQVDELLIARYGMEHVFYLDGRAIRLRDALNDAGLMALLATELTNGVEDIHERA